MLHALHAYIRTYVHVRACIADSNTIRAPPLQASISSCHVIHVKEPCHAYEGVMGTRVIESWNACGGVMAHMYEGVMLLAMKEP